jgi:hypothetical protein
LSATKTQQCSGSKLLKLKGRCRDWFKEIIKIDSHVLSKIEQRGLLVGMLLGAGKRNQNNFLIQHSIAQENYILYKKEVLELITQKPVSLRRVHYQGKDFLSIEPKQIPLIRVLVQKLYPAGTQKISRKFLNLLTLPGIAIWFMDKGAKSFKKKNGKIHALEVTLNTYLSQLENEVIVTYFSEVWGFQWGLSKSKNTYRLRMGTQAGKQFLSVIRPYVHPSMLYKVEPSLNRTATT